MVTIVGFVGNINSDSYGETRTIATSQPPGQNIDLRGGIFTQPYNTDVVIATYDTSGILQRAFRRGGSGMDTATGVAFDLEGNLYVTGRFNGAGKYPNLFVEKYLNGALVWVQTAVLGGPLFVEGDSPSVSVGADGTVFVAGGYQGAARFGSIGLHGTGASNIFVAELSPVISLAESGK